MASNEFEALKTIARRSRRFRIHCVYCGATTRATTILWAMEPEDVQQSRLAFELEHDKTCGPKSIGMIAEIDTEDSEK